MKHILMTFGILVAVSGCSNIPNNIKSPPPNNIQINQVIQEPTQTQGQLVRWGGKIIEVENENDKTLIQMVQFPLNHYGKPVPTRDSDGRFIARSLKFFDPAVYQEGDLMTLVGTVANDRISRTVDRKQIEMPVIDINESYRWKPYQEPRQSLYYDPFFYPSYRFYHNYWYDPRFGYRYYYY